jgi:hypothetical protein
MVDKLERDSRDTSNINKDLSFTISILGSFVKKNNIQLNQSTQKVFNRLSTHFDINKKRENLISLFFIYLF